jgi:2-methylisocitrate lyase-like PEP mutase family enzyme
MLINAKSIVEATDLPVSADLEGGFSSDPQAVAETIHLAANTGLVGGSIEVPPEMQDMGRRLT